MSAYSIRIENIGKQFKIGNRKQPLNFREAIAQMARAPWKWGSNIFRKKGNLNGGEQNRIWALQDVSFKAKQGEVIGIIGRNAAGKSTLLKILSRVTEPTCGKGEINGRIGTLIEVGAGFHPELTGRENVFLNGVTLGMKRDEIKKKFDEIVNFSGVEEFIDTPVKRYSSGMFLRLGFAVAAHLEPDILIVDEILAVGDIEFQKKCMGKMDKVAKEGMTVLFVSHNMGAVTRLCDRAIWLEKGMVKMDGNSQEVVSKYIALGCQEIGAWVNTENRDNRPAILKQARVVSRRENRSREVPTVFEFYEQLKVIIEYEIKKSVKNFQTYLLLRGPDGSIIWASHDTDGTDWSGEERDPGMYFSTCLFPEGILRPGWYQISVGIKGKPREIVEDEHLDVISFQISEVGYRFNADPRMGILTPCLPWNIERQ
jgi:lipopolysaccharide transport system ATP-binding protein